VGEAETHWEEEEAASNAERRRGKDEKCGAGGIRMGVRTTISSH
jgi:hypothetical protein